MSPDEELEGLEVLSRNECTSLLAAGFIGRVGFVAAGRPHVLPVNYVADEAGVVVFRTASSSILMATAGQEVAFEVDGVDRDRRTGWSVCVLGSVREMARDDDATSDRLRAKPVVSWAPGRRERWMAVTPAEITGRRIPVLWSEEGVGGWYPGVPS